MMFSFLSRNLLILISFIVCVLISADVAGQKKVLPVNLKSGTIIPETFTSSIDVNNRLLSSSVFNNKIYLFIQLESLPDQQKTQKINQSGIHLLEYIPENTYLASVDKNITGEALKSLGASAFLIKPENKLDPDLSEIINTARDKAYDPVIDVMVSGYADIEKGALIQALEKISAPTRKTELFLSNSYLVSLPASKIAELLTAPFVSYVEPAAAKSEILINESGILHGSRALQNDFPGIGRKLSGKGVIIGLGDEGGITSHIDHYYNTIHDLSFPDNHATLVSGIMAGAGILNPLLSGHAPKAGVLVEDFSGIISQTPLYYTNYGMVLTNNSYGNTGSSCTAGGKYSSISIETDNQLLQYPEVLHVFAAGNNGSVQCQPFPTAYATVQGHYQSAKNVLTVGGSTKDNLTNVFSKGPVKDGRLKPEITAVGSGGVLSTAPNNTFQFTGGTSAAAPQVTGVLALLIERYRQLNNNKNPKAAFIKAVVCNAATDVGRKGPDFENGFGLLNGLDAATILENKSYFNDSLQNTQQKTFTVNVEAGIQQFKTMLYWADVPPSLYAYSALVNDLDITITAPDGSVSKPLVLDPSPINVLNLAIPGEDHTNNIEQVVIDNPLPGNYLITVKGYNVPFGLQEFFVVYHKKQKGLRLTYPVGNEKWKSNEPQMIAWEEPDQASANYGVALSADGGINWQSVGIVTNKNQLRITVPAVVSVNSLVRITNLSTGKQVSSAAFRILPEINFQALAVCEGTIQVNWPLTAGIDSMNIVMLKDGEMQAIATTRDTSYIIPRLSRDSIYWITVQPCKNNFSGERSIAKSLTANGNGCSLPQNNGDIKLDNIISPQSGRKLTSTKRGASEPIQVQLKNLDDDATSTPIVLKVFVNKVLFTTDTITTAITGNGSLLYTFGKTINLTLAGKYMITVVAEKADDPDNSNNTIGALVKVIENNPVTIPFKENFLQLKDSTYTYPGYVGIEGAEAWDYSTGNMTGRLAAVTGVPGKGLYPYKTKHQQIAAAQNIIISTYNLAAYNTNDNIRLSVYPGTLPFSLPLSIRGSDTSVWLPVIAYDIFDYNLNGININITKLLKDSSQQFSSSFQMQFAGQNNGQSIQEAQPLNGITLYNASNDIRALQVTSGNLNYYSTDTLHINFRIANTVNTTVNNIKIFVQLPNGKLLPDSIGGLAAYDTASLFFVANANELKTGTDTLNAWISCAGDSFHSNDSTSLIVNVLPVIQQFPYHEGFEEGKKEWSNSSVYNLYNNHTAKRVDKAANGNSFWYHNSDKQIGPLYYFISSGTVNSPGFNLSGLKNPYISFSTARYLRTGVDSSYIEYSFNKGKTFNRLAGQDTVLTGTILSIKPAGATVPKPIGMSPVTRYRKKTASPYSDFG